MRIWTKLAAAMVLVFVGASAAQADTVTCGNASLGIRTTSVDPALVGGVCYGGLTNLGDDALEDLVDTGSDAVLVVHDEDSTFAHGCGPFADLFRRRRPFFPRSP